MVKLSEKSALEYLNQAGSYFQVPTSSYLQGQTADWDRGERNGFSYFPINLNLTYKNGQITKAERVDIVRSAIRSIVTKKNIQKTKFDNETDAFVTCGSCFATELHSSLTRQGINSATFRIEESINTAHANLLLFKSIARGKLHGDLCDIIQDDAIEARLALLLSQLNQAKIIVLTLGVAPVIVNQDTQAIVYQKNLRENLSAARLQCASRLLMRTMNT